MNQVNTVFSIFKKAIEMDNMDQIIENFCLLVCEIWRTWTEIETEILAYIMEDSYLKFNESLEKIKE